MKTFELTILGSNSALPAYGRFPTSQVLNYNNDLTLIDCGEGAQMRLTDYKIKRNNISKICISHHHGDHLYGLPGVITSMNHQSRKAPLLIIGPKGIQKYIDVLMEIGEVHLNFELTVKELEVEELSLVYEDDQMIIEAFPVFHRIPTFGYKFSEKSQEINIQKETILKFGLSIEEIKLLKQGLDIERSSGIIKNGDCTLPHDPPRVYSYCADSKVDDSLIPIIANSDLLYFETTYLHELQKQAQERGHATAREAATLAKASNVKQLITGHYSSRYRDVQPILDEAKQVFDNVILGYDGVVVSL